MRSGAHGRLQYLIDGTTSIVSALGFSRVEASDDAVKHFTKTFLLLCRSENHCREFLVVSLFCAPS